MVCLSYLILERDDDSATLATTLDVVAHFSFVQYSQHSFAQSSCSCFLDAMDPASVRALMCAGKRPFGSGGEILIREYLTDHRSVTLLDTTPEAPSNRCIQRGRCIKTVSKAAIVQLCCKHQPGGGNQNPGDDTVCHWSWNKAMQR